ncbi:hypothetical protein JADG_007709 [Aureobasidium aubasidani]|nr:hypothetical protein JADG_007709 [Aureobasidium pullulans]
MGKQPSVELTSLGLASGTTTRTPSISGPSNECNPQPVNTDLEASSDDETPLNDEAKAILSKGRTIVVIAQLVGVQLFSSFCNGIIVIGLPAIAKALEMEAGLQLWPTSVFYLTAGSCLMLAGSLADVLGTRPLILSANILLAVSALACGLARNGGEIIAFRGLQGVANAMAVPASVSMISTSVEDGQRRNMGFSCLGFAGPLGFLLGLILGGVFVDGVGWRPAFYLVAAASFTLGLVGFWALPNNSRPHPRRSIKKQLATLSASVRNIKTATTISLLVVGIATVPAFICWMAWQEKTGKPALIPNSFWQNLSFTSVCIMILFSTAVINGMEVYVSLFFQQVQGLSALGASIRILPALITAVMINISTGYFVNRMPVVWIVLASCGLTSISPMLMAIINPRWTYWKMAFFAQLLQGISVNVLFTVGLLIISSIFPLRTQALGGAVFNTCAQLGTSIGLTITSVIADSRTAASGIADKTSPDALMTGYRAVFWALFAWMIIVLLAGVFGLRKVGKIGVKRD